MVRSISSFAVVHVDYNCVAIANVSFYSELSLQKYSLPNLKGALSSQLPSRAIALASKEVASVFQQNGNSVKRQHGSYLQRW